MAFDEHAFCATAVVVDLQVSRNVRSCKVFAFPTLKFNVEANLQYFCAVCGFSVESTGFLRDTRHQTPAAYSARYQIEQYSFFIDTRRATKFRIHKHGPEKRIERKLCLGTERSNSRRLSILMLVGREMFYHVANNMA
jgi:hypothetical protein